MAWPVIGNTRRWKGQLERDSYAIAAEINPFEQFGQGRRGFAFVVQAGEPFLGGAQDRQQPMRFDSGLLTCLRNQRTVGEHLLGCT
jgi:hypothetical protein